MLKKLFLIYYSRMSNILFLSLSIEELLQFSRLFQREAILSLSVVTLFPITIIFIYQNLHGVFFRNISFEILSTKIFSVA